MATINGKAYSFSKIAIVLGGVQLMTLSSIDYEVTQEKTNEYGNSPYPVLRGEGAKEFTASVELSFNEIQQLRKLSKELNPDGDGSLVDLPPFDILVMYDNGQELVRHKLLYCEFTKDGVSGSQGDTNLKYSLELAVGNIIFV